MMAFLLLNAIETRESGADGSHGCWSVMTLGLLPLVVMLEVLVCQ